MRTEQALFLACVLMASSGIASAQAPPVPATPPAATAPPAPGRPNDCAPIKSPSQGTTTGQSQEPLGDRLARSDGVLCPPAGIDPQIRAPTPDAGNMPVISPPGSPGGDPNIRPK